VVVGGGARGTAVRGAAEAAVILLDTNAMIWLATGHARARPLARFARLYVSPVSLLEVQFLHEIGRITFAGGRSIEALAEDPRWRLDEPPAGRWFMAACAMAWTLDPFDRLLAAHARVRGWKIATSDNGLLENLASNETFEL
jgi:PIN domain nuclease of toxin-antitoxin system